MTPYVSESAFRDQDLQADARLYCMQISEGLRVTLSNLGASIQKIEMKTNDTWLCVTPHTDEYEVQKKSWAFPGSTIGRFANRIRDGRYIDQDQTIQLQQNIPEGHHLHGGFPSVAWTAFETETSINEHDIIIDFKCRQDDGHCGYPGDMELTVRYRLTQNDELHIEYSAKLSKRCPMNLTNHVYFNLSGHDHGDLTEHQLLIPTPNRMEFDAENLPNGEFAAYHEAYNFEQAKDLHSNLFSLADHNFSGYDHCYYFGRDQELKLQAQLSHSSGRSVEIWATMPAIQVYTANYLGGHPGPNGIRYKGWGAVALEPEYVPNAPNLPQFGDCFYGPERPYDNKIIMRFKA